MANAEAYAQWIVANADKKGTPEFETVAAAYQAARAVGAQDEPFAAKLGRQVLNAGAGAIRGAGSIGATLMAPMDMLNSAAMGRGANTGLSNRREGMTAALGSMGADTDSLAFGAGKLGTEIAGTLGVGGAIAGVAGRALPAGAAPLLDAIRTAGMSAGGVGGKAGVGIRAAGGGITEAPVVGHQAAVDIAGPGARERHVQRRRAAQRGRRDHGDGRLTA